MDMKTYEIYKHTAPNGMAYIGQTCNRKARDTAHKRNKKINPFTEAIAEFGWDSFTHETLVSGLNKKKADAVEIELIAKHNTVYPNGLNLHTGGELPRLADLKHNEAYLKERPLHTRKIKPAAKDVVIPNEAVKYRDPDLIRERQERAMSIPEELLQKERKRCSNVGGPRGYRGARIPKKTKEFLAEEYIPQTHGVLEFWG